MKHELTDTIYLVLVMLGSVERLENILVSTAFFPCSAERLSLRRVKSKRPRLQKDKTVTKNIKWEQDIKEVNRIFQTKLELCF
jgi:hypothetical protein